MTYHLQMSREGRRKNSVLVVEDEILIALDMVDTLEEHGFQVLGPAATVPAALALLVQHRPDAAVLDVSLRSHLVTPVARVLHSLHVPFVIASGCSLDSLPQDEALVRAPKLSKPTPPSLLAAVLHDLLERAGSTMTKRHWC